MLTIILAKLKVETAWTMAAHSSSTHAAHTTAAHVIHPEHAWPTKKRLEYLIWIHFTCNN